MRFQLSSYCFCMRSWILTWLLRNKTTKKNICNAFAGNKTISIVVEHICIIIWKRRRKECITNQPLVISFDYIVSDLADITWRLLRFRMSLCWLDINFFIIHFWLICLMLMFRLRVLLFEALFYARIVVSRYVCWIIICMA